MSTPPGDGVRRHDAPQTHAAPVAASMAPGRGEFTVPVPQSDTTQALPEVAHTRVLPTAAPDEGGPAVPPPPPNPWNSYGAPAPAAGPVLAATVAPDAAGLPTGLFTAGLVLLGVLVGWWFFFGVRLVWWLVQVGATSTSIISTIDAVPEETVAAVVVAVATVATLVIARSMDAARRGTAVVGAAVALALATVVMAVWRFV